MSDIEHVPNAEASLTLSVTDWKMLLRTATFHTYMDGQAICRKGDVLPGIFQICHGVVNVKIEMPVIENETPSTPPPSSAASQMEDVKKHLPKNRSVIVQPPKPTPPKVSLQTIAILATNDIFGEMSFFDGRTASADLEAGEGGTTVLKLESRKLVEMLAGDMVLRRKFFYFLLVILCHRLRTVTKQVTLQRQCRTLASAAKDKVCVCVCVCVCVVMGDC